MYPSPSTITEGPTLELISLNGTFERKQIPLPFKPGVCRIGRQTGGMTVPTQTNGFFDSNVLSRSHAEVWADSEKTIWIRDAGSSNGTYLNGVRLSAEGRKSEDFILQIDDVIELGIDILSEDQTSITHHKIIAKVTALE